MRVSTTSLVSGVSSADSRTTQLYRSAAIVRQCTVCSCGELNGSSHFCLHQYGSRLSLQLATHLRNHTYWMTVQLDTPLAMYTPSAPYTRYATTEQGMRIDCVCTAVCQSIIPQQHSSITSPRIHSSVMHTSAHQPTRPRTSLPSLLFFSISSLTLNHSLMPSSP